MSNGAGIILAGGKAKRLGGISKADIVIGGINCLDRTRNVLGQGVSCIAVCGQVETDLETLADWPDAGRGGVAFAVLGALDWAQKRGLDFIITAPVDTPFLPRSFTQELTAAYENQSGSITFKHNGRVQGLHALWPVLCLGSLKDLILKSGNCKIDSLHDKLKSNYLQLAQIDVDPFLNLNTQADVDAAQNMARTYKR